MGNSDNLRGMIGQRIRDARKARVLTQAKLAEMVGVAQPSLSAWESGDTMPSTENLVVLAMTLSVSFEWLATGRGEMDYREVTAREAGAAYAVQPPGKKSRSQKAALPPGQMTSVGDALAVIMLAVAKLVGPHKLASALAEELRDVQKFKNDHQRDALLARALSVLHIRASGKDPYDGPLH